MTTTQTFLPENFDPSDFANIEPLCKELATRELNTADALRTWIQNATELFEVIWEYASRKNIDNACHTDDEEKEKAYLHFIREISPKLKPAVFEFQKHFLASPALDQLTEPSEKIMKREWETEVKLFNPDNIPLQTKEKELGTEYGKICGAMLVTFQGEEMTLQQLGKFLEEPDRDTRREAWTLSAERRLEDRDKIEDIFEQQLELRHKIANNSGFNDYRDYMWQAKMRFDYTPDDCLDFGRAVETCISPINAKVDQQRKDELNLDKYRPYDTSFDVKGRPPLRPFNPDNIDEFIDGTKAIFNKISPQLATQFEELRTNGNLDLDSRKGKRPGGFQASLQHSKQPFIFMNAAGTQRDVDVMLHEGGHAFHYQDSRNIPNLFVRSAPLEFCEVASMSMELLGCDHYNVFYNDEEQAARAKRQQIEGVLKTLPWIAIIDGFQHWLYTNPAHTRQQRQTQWLSILDRFNQGPVDWTGYEAIRECLWHRQLHLFEVPFYYIEYGIAQLGALGVWLNYQQDPKQALAQLQEAFALGGTRPLPELFETAGIPFDFSENAIAPLAQAVQKELETLPI